MNGTSQVLAVEENKKDTNFRKILNESLKVFFMAALRVTLKNPLQAYYFFRTVKGQKKPARTRLNWKHMVYPTPCS